MKNCLFSCYYSPTVSSLGTQQQKKHFQIVDSFSLSHIFQLMILNSESKIKGYIVSVLINTKKVLDSSYMYVVGAHRPPST